MTWFGPDVSIYQSGINLTQADWDIDFLIARCIRRGREVDSSFERWRTGAQRYDVPFGSYAFVRPLSIVPLRQQVDAILRAMGDTPVPVWFDHERDGNIPPVSDHDLLLLGQACADAGLSVPTVYTGWFSDTDPFTPTDLAFLGYSGIINARYPRQSSTTPPRGDPEEWYETIGGDTGVGWDYDPGPNVSPVPVLAWQYTSACDWGDADRVDWNAVTSSAVMSLLFHDWTPAPTPEPEPEPVPEPVEGDEMAWMIAKDAGNGDSWEASPDGRNRLHVPSMVAPEVVFASGRAWDVSGNRWVTSFAAVIAMPTADLAAKLGPRAR